MLNTLFPKKIIEQYKIDYDNYILPKDLQGIVAKLNHDLDVGGEDRLQEFYTYELWDKINSLPLIDFKWEESKILDICSGLGFLSYHILKKVNPKEITLLDISPYAVEESKKLIGNHFPDVNAKYIEADIFKTQLLDNSFDMIIGNSFIHHFYDVPATFNEINRLLKPGGVFVTIHEPSIAAVAYESGKFSRVILWLLRGEKYIEDIRKLKGDFSLDKNIGGDVWIFSEKDLTKLLHQSNFSEVTLKPRHIFRSFFVSFFKLTLNDKKETLSKFDEKIIRFGIILDNFLAKILPTRLFGSFIICAYKK